MNIENYLEEHNVYDIFEGLMKSLIKEKPEDPIKHLIEKLEVEERKIYIYIYIYIAYSQKNHHYGTPRESKKGIFSLSG